MRLERGTVPREALWVEGVNAVTADIDLAIIRQSVCRDRTLGRKDGHWRRPRLWVWDPAFVLADGRDPSRYAGGVSPEISQVTSRYSIPLSRDDPDPRDPREETKNRG